MTVEIAIDEGLCMGAGECIARAPRLFEWTTDRTQARVSVATTADDEIAREAERNCPNFAVSVRVVVDPVDPRRQ